MKYKYDVIEKTIAYQGFFRLDRYRLRHELFAGGWSRDMQRECLERGQAVAVLLYDPNRDQVVLIEQFRLGALHAPNGPWLLEIVAGIVEPGEAKPDVARREALEEAGCTVLELVPVCECFVSPGGTSETVTVYCGRVNAELADGIHGLDEEHEDILVHVFSRAEALQLLHDGRIRSAPTVIALQWLALNHNDLQQRWSTM